MRIKVVVQQNVLSECKYPAKKQRTPKSSSRPQRRKIVARAPARICTPHLEGNASIAFHGTFLSSKPALSIPITRGNRSWWAIKAPIRDDAQRRSVHQGAWPGRNCVPIEKNNAAENTISSTSVLRGCVDAN